MLAFSPVISGKQADKLEDRWQGLGKLTPVIYCIDMHDKHRKQKSVHVTALRAWQEPIVDVQFFDVDGPVGEELPE